MTTPQREYGGKTVHAGCKTDPARAKFLKPDEKLEVERRLREDRSSLADEYHIKYFFDAMKDWKIYVHMFITIGKSFSRDVQSAELTSLFFAKYRHIYSVVLIRPVSPDHCKEHGIRRRAFSADDRPAIRRCVHLHHHSRLGGG
jgi:hypothetical protein